ncbi:hypothetical protein INT45_010177 [Circinella minor]|uniref:Reelin domain-containing protein n=1 Tax=Circinella minor TaxID=1195481 RepID=A0A8H7VS93_9FUNG|nr:hypothetical protein INT45_010177 [Circinella minor]
MMKLVQLASLATVMLQLGTFVQANPLFDSAHSNDGSQEDVCSSLSFEDNSRHLVAWQAPSSIQQVNVTIVNSEQKTVAMVNVFDASKGASGEIPISLNGQDTGEFHFHLAGIGGPACQADSPTFEITRDDGQQQSSDDDDSKKQHENDDAKAWSHAVQQVSDYTKDDKKEHDNAKWFTNDDQRTHLNAHLNKELDELFSTNHDNAAQWQAIEVDVESEPEHEDSGENLFDHTNAGTWTDEDFDPKHVDVEGFQAEEHNDDAEVEYVMDYSNVGAWQEEQINPNDDASTEHENSGWVEDIQKFDHTNVGAWQEEQIADDQEEQGHTNAVEWQAEVIDVAGDHSGAQDHGNVASGGWVEEDASGAQGHGNIASGGWVEEDASGAQGHGNVASGQWVEDDAQSHNDQDAWIAQEIDGDGVVSGQHNNEAKEPAPPSDTEWHVNDVNIDSEWQDESSANANVADHTDAAPFIQAEIEALAEQSVHSDAAEGWYEEESTHKNESPSSGKVGTGRMPPSIDSTHDNDGTIPVVPAEALIAKW